MDIYNIVLSEIEQKYLLEQRLVAKGFALGAIFILEITKTLSNGQLNQLMAKNTELFWQHRWDNRDD